MSESGFVSAVVDALVVIGTYVLAYLVSVALHELGHAALGKLAGLRIVACGIGFRRPLCHLRIGETSYFVARPFLGGMTLAVHESVGPCRSEFLLCVAGGPLASLVAMIGAAAGLAYLRDGNHFLLGVAGFSAYNFWLSAVPHRSRSSGMDLMNDAMIMQAYWRHEHFGASQPGRDLDTSIAMRRLCDDLKTKTGAIHKTLAIASQQIALSDLESARETLSDPILFAPDRGSVGRRRETFHRALLDVAVGGPKAEILPAAEAELQDEPYAVMALRLSALQVRVEAPVASLTELDDILAECRRRGFLDLQRHAEALRLSIKPSEDLLRQVRRLSTERSLDPLTVLSLISASIQPLDASGRRDEARAVFAEALRRLGAIAATISVETTRNRFLERFSAPLRKALAEGDDGIPLFVPDEAVMARSMAAPRGREGLTPLGRTVILIVVFVLGLVAGAVLMEIDRVPNADLSTPNDHVDGE